MKQKILIYDLETTSTKVNKAEFRLMGFTSSETEGFKWCADVNAAKRIIEAHDIIVGWNIRDYDNEIMKKYNTKFYGKVVIDLMNIIHGSGFGNDKGRKGIMTTPDGAQLGAVLHSKKLSDCAIALNVPTKKMAEFDYNLFRKNWHELTADERKYCLDYLEHDVLATQQIYEYLETFFSDLRNGGITINEELASLGLGNVGEFKPYLTSNYIKSKKYLTWSTASLVYHIVCNLVGVEPKFADGAEREDYGGGFVALPTQESVRGKIYCLDYNSLYPHIMIMCNLYARKNAGWHGAGFTKPVGYYDDVQLSPIGALLKHFYNQRLIYKKSGDERQYTIKIIINTVYGLLGNPVFANFCDFVSASDCTRIGRQWIKEAREHFRSAGYHILYTDTDSVYIADPFDDEERIMRVKQEHVDKIKTSVPFPVDTFDMGIDDKINYMGFFKSPDGRFKKKNYLYVAWDKKTGTYNKLVIKGLPIIKSNATKLGKLVFDKYLRQSIIQTQNHKFLRGQILSAIEAELDKDITLASVFYKVRPQWEYANSTQLQAQIAHKLGEGQYNLLKTKHPHPEGFGVNKNYVLSTANVSIAQLDLTKTLNELEPFMLSEQKSLSLFF